MERLFEEVFVEVCAPTLRGIKPSNLFRYQPQNRDKLLEALDFWNRVSDSGVPRGMASLHSG